MARRTAPATKPVRCAIYTRKSTDEGLDNGFSSLDAQREAAEAFIQSQKHEGWIHLPDRYADGGFSGGSMDRPALQRLLTDVEAGHVDAVVVYKVDRLSRSLLDFARIMEVLDGHGAAFVSITQQFATNTSIGRLTLNMLLSFAQFGGADCGADAGQDVGRSQEREVGRRDTDAGIRRGPQGWPAGRERA
jgi:site-specific DNA recombinase